jgi:hypothetical protein
VNPQLEKARGSFFYIGAALSGIALYSPPFFIETLF